MAISNEAFDAIINASTPAQGTEQIRNKSSFGHWINKSVTANAPLHRIKLIIGALSNQSVDNTYISIMGE